MLAKKSQRLLTSIMASNSIKPRQPKDISIQVVYTPTQRSTPIKGLHSNLSNDDFPPIPCSDPSKGEARPSLKLQSSYLETPTYSKAVNNIMASDDEPALRRAKTSDSTKLEETDLMVEFENQRKKTAKSVLDFKFNEKRVRILSAAQEVPDWAEGVVYWMFRDERVQDNWALLFAQKLALQKEIPLHVCFCRKLNFLEATIRHYNFLLKGLEEVEAECKSLNIEFHLLFGNGEEILPAFVEKNKMGAVVIDFMPLRSVMSWADKLKKSLSKDVPLCQVDAHNIVPCWTASDKLEDRAFKMRDKITRQLPEFLTEFPAVAKHPFSGAFKADKIDWEKADETLEVDRTVGPVSTFTPGYKAAIRTLDDFCNKRLRLYGSKRNDPTVNAQSNLSPYFHFGQLSVQRAILHVKKFSSMYKESYDSFINEALIWRELSENFCFYNKNYDNISGACEWAKKTLNDHRKDKRQYVYTRAELEEGKTHDNLWNAAQIQMVKEGKMHGFCRMYWAKKILEWTATPEEALADAIYLNDRYNLDGRDPSGYAGCMWSICGALDREFSEREIYGKIRYMSYEGSKRKFDVAAFVARYRGEMHKYVKK